jgi:hypothetical protein
MEENMEQNNNNKKSWITWNLAGFFLLVIVIGANFYVWKARAADETQMTSLSGNLAAVQQQINKVAEPAGDLKTRLAAAEAAYAATQTGFPTAVDRNEVMDYLLDVAEENSVQILPLTSEGWKMERNGQQYNVLSFTATVSGSLENVLNLIDSLHNGKYRTLAISDCIIHRENANSPGFPGEDMPVTVAISLGIYTFVPEGDAL